MHYTEEIKPKFDREGSQTYGSYNLLTKNAFDMKKMPSSDRRMSMVSLAEKILEACLGSDLPLLEKFNYMKIAMSNLTEFLSVKLPLVGIDNKEYYRKYAYQLLEEIRIIASTCLDYIEENNIEILDKVDVYDYKTIQKLSNKDGNVDKDHFYVFMVNKDDPDETYFTNVGLRPVVIDIDEDKYTYVLMRFIPQPNITNKDYKRPIKDLSTIVDDTLMDFKFSPNKKYHAYVWYGDNIKDNTIISTALYKNRVFQYKAHEDCLIMYRDFSKTKKANPSLSFKKNPSIFYNVDYIESLKSDREYLYRTPLESYNNVVNFIGQMCSNPNTEEIWFTIYRLSPRSKILGLILGALQRGVKVNLYIEVEARGNEIYNRTLKRILGRFERDRRLHIYRLDQKRKVHSKIFLVRDKDGRFYTHVSTGNYNEITGGQYIDLQYITSNQHVCQAVFEILHIINYEEDYKEENSQDISEYSFEFLKAAIKREINKGKDGRIFIKCNHIRDRTIERLLKKAAMRGVEVVLCIRSTNGLERFPGIKSYYSIGRFLEHERIYIFGKEKVVYMGSCDLLTRSLKRRIETIVPIMSTVNRQFVLDILGSIMYSS